MLAMNGHSPRDHNPDTSERRARRRLYVQARAVVLLPQELSLEVETVEISEEGVCLTSPIELVPGTWCRLRIQLLPASATEISVSGRVCFCIEQRGVYRIGIHCAESHGLVAAFRES